MRLAPVIGAAATAQECSAHRESQEGGAKWRDAQHMKRNASGRFASAALTQECLLLLLRKSQQPQFAHLSQLFSDFFIHCVSVRNRRDGASCTGRPSSPRREAAARSVVAERMRRSASGRSASEALTGECSIGAAQRAGDQRPTTVGAFLRVTTS
jgi:hypothetical protein